jgi:hypothetical protein
VRCMAMNSAARATSTWLSSLASSSSKSKRPRRLCGQSASVGRQQRAAAAAGRRERQPAATTPACGVGAGARARRFAARRAATCYDTRLPLYFLRQLLLQQRKHVVCPAGGAVKRACAAAPAGSARCCRRRDCARACLRYAAAALRRPTRGARGMQHIALRGLDALVTLRLCVASKTGARKF